MEKIFFFKYQNYKQKRKRQKSGNKYWKELDKEIALFEKNEDKFKRNFEKITSDKKNKEMHEIKTMCVCVSMSRFACVCVCACECVCECVCERCFTQRIYKKNKVKIWCKHNFPILAACTAQ